MVSAIVTGATGRMGRAIMRCVRDADDFKLVGATERPGTSVIGIDAGLAAHLGPLEVPVGDDLAKTIASSRPDVVIDFTSADASVKHAMDCSEGKVALVVGSTGFSAEARSTVVAAAKKIPIVMAPNMSVGVNVMLRLVREAAQVLGNRFEVEVAELHHRDKKDAPSGTALRLAEVAAEALGRTPEDFLYARHGDLGKRPPQQIGIQSLRGGDVVGEHTVFFFGEGERLELTHRASSRDQFASGAVRAARWVVGKPAGLYDMQDVLGFK
jgi:4-hydroxy-tetrahydrodipicolinate reductase